MTDLIVPPVDAPPAPACPYVGLVPFAEEQQRFFFGRERDSSLLADNLIAYRLTLVYGPSGAGKSSIMAAGVIPELRRQSDDAHGDTPSSVVVRLSAWRDDPFLRLQDALTKAAMAAGHIVDPEPEQRDWTLRQALAHWSERLNAEFYFILDQFEEYFLYHDDVNDRFAVELAEAVAGNDRWAHFLLSVREDALAKLDRFQGRIPNLFDNYYRLDHLDATQARSAIVGPLEEANRGLPESAQMTIEPELVDTVLQQVRTGQVQVGNTGEGKIESSTGREAVETAHLQLVMTRLWEAERQAGSNVMRLSTLNALGGAPAIVRGHLDKTMAELPEHDQHLAARVFKQLVTPSGTKIAHRADDLADYAGVPTPELEAVLERLAAGDLRVLRPVPPPPGQLDGSRYEIFHDALAGAILDWRERHDREESEAAAKAELAEAKALAAKERRRRLIVTGLGVLALIALAASVVLLIQNRAQSKRRKADQLANEALAVLEADPALAAATVVEAWDTSHTPTAESALRQIAAETVQVDLVLTGHSNGVLAAVPSPDGSRILTTSADGTARLWDPASGDSIVTLEGHTGAVFDGTFSHDGATVATFSRDRTARLWDAETGEELALLESEGGTFYKVEFSRDDSRVVTGGWNGSNYLVDVWDAKTGEKLLTLDNAGVDIRDVTFTDRNDEIVTADQDGYVSVWSTLSGQKIADMILPEGFHRNTMLSLAVTADGEKIAAGGRFGDLYVWYWHDPAFSTKYLAPPSTRVVRDVIGVAFSPDGTELVSFSDKFARLWPVPEAIDAYYSSTHVPLESHKDWVSDAVFSADGRSIVTGGRDGTAFVSDATTGSLVTRLRGHGGPIGDVAFMPDGRILSASDDGTARIWKKPEGDILSGHEDWVIDGALSADETKLASVDADGGVKVWDLKTSTQMGNDFTDPDTYLGFLNTVTIDPTGTYVAAGSSDYWRVWVWEIDGDHDAPIAEFVDKAGVTSIGFSPDGERMAVGLYDGTVHLWNWQSDDPIARTLVASDTVMVEWAPDGKSLATGGADGRVQLWDTGTYQEIRAWDAHSSQVWDLGFSPEGERLVTASADREARIWDTATGEQLRSFRGHSVLSGASFAPSGDRVVTAAADGTIAVWEADTGVTLALLNRHADAANWAEMLEDSRIVSVGDDNLARVYPCTTCVPAGELADALREQLEQLNRPVELVESAEVVVGTLGPGRCLLDIGDVVERVENISCDEPHALEVYALYALPRPADAEFPGDDPLFDLAEDYCASEFFEDYVGIPAEDSIYDTRVLIPTQASWENSLDRRVTCMLEHPDGDVTGSGKGSEE